VEASTLLQSEIDTVLFHADQGEITNARGGRIGHKTESVAIRERGDHRSRCGGCGRNLGCALNKASAHLIYGFVCGFRREDPTPFDIE